MANFIWDSVPDLYDPKADHAPLDPTIPITEAWTALDTTQIRNGLLDLRSRAQVSLTYSNANTTLHVDVVSGNDTNTGDIANPLRTLDEALRRAAFEWSKYTCTISLHAATPTVVVGNWTISRLVNPLKSSLSDVWLQIKCEDYSLVTGLTGPNTGTFTATSGVLQTMASATWATDELRGWLLEMTSGTLNGKRYAIDGNTGNGIRVGHVDAGFNGASFRIVRPNIEFQASDTTRPHFAVSGGKGYANSINFYGIYATGGTKAFRVYESASFEACIFKDQTTYNVEARHGDVSVLSYCYLQSPNGNNTAICYAADYSRRINLFGCVLYGPGNTGTSRSLQIRPGYMVVAGQPTDPVFIRNVTSGAIFEQGTLYATIIMGSDVPSSGVFSYNQNSYFEQCNISGPNVAVVYGATSQITAPGDHASCRMIDSTISGASQGVIMDRTSRGSLHTYGSTNITGGINGIKMDGSHSYLETSDQTIISGTTGPAIDSTGMCNAINLLGGSGAGVKIRNSTIGIRVAGDGTRVMCGSGTTSIENNSVSGVDLQGVGCSFKSSSALSMSGNNGSQDFRKAPGAAYFSLATLRGLTGPPAKLDKDANYMNVVWEP